MGEGAPGQHGDQESRNPEVIVVVSATGNAQGGASSDASAGHGHGGVRRRRWPEWVPAAAVASSVVYAAVETTWAVTGSTVPFARHTPYSPTAQLVLAALALVAGAVCRVAGKPPGRWGRRVVTAGLALTVPVFAMGMAALPAYFVTLASGSGPESVTGLVHVLLSTALVSCLVLVGLSHRRRLTGRCPRCGSKSGNGSGDGSGHGHDDGRDAPVRHPDASPAPPRTRKAAYLLLCGLLPWAAVKTVWTLGGDAFGVTAEKWKESDSGGSEAVRALAAVGIDVTVLAAGLGVFLLTGLMYRWGQVFPRWVPFLSGRRVPRLLPLVPAWLTAVGLSVYGVVLVVYAPLAALGVLPAPEPDAELGATPAGTLWLAAFGGLAFGGLGFGLLLASRSYYARTRPVCATGFDRTGTEAERPGASVTGRHGPAAPGPVPVSPAGCDGMGRHEVKPSGAKRS
ncbi:hypothetical protein [Streptomyces sp. sk2.1]|uniref:hypothetical protein n=1 Tax=Streptomyces sp. sk2.1 TaxID=2478959 RepID=UPI0016532DB6|nr:hypothetical protein [Streptomyces sp. sk2.1]